MNKLVIIILIALGIWAFYQYGVDFVAKVNSTVDKANSSMKTDVNNINSAIKYNNGQ